MPYRRYRLFGLVIESPFDLSPLSPESPASTVDIKLSEGNVPATLGDVAAWGAWWSMAPSGDLLLAVPGVGRALIQRGESITFERRPGATTGEVTYGIVQSIVPPTLHQRGDIVLHASALMTPNGALCVLGHSGAGKSTVALAASRRGHSVLSDDVTPVRWLSEGPMTFAGPSAVAVWNDSRERFGGQGALLGRARERANKFVLATNAPPTAGPFPIRACVLLTEHPKADVEVSQLTGRDAFMALKVHTRGRRLAEQLHLMSYFSRIAQLAEDIPILRVGRPRKEIGAADAVLDALTGWML